MHGAAILYNLYLAELDPRRSEVVDQCDALLGHWIALIAERRGSLLDWDREDFWALLHARQYAPSMGTRQFVDEWRRRVLDGDVAKLRGAESTRELIFSREAQVKGTLARCNNRRSREMWNGEAGLGRLDFRWSNAQVILGDVASGLAGHHA
jgi:hypothetical protein